MKKFILEGDTRIRNMSEYKAEYEGKIYCEDENCNAKIFLVKGNIMPPYFKVLSPGKHSEECDAKSKNKSKPRKKLQNTITGVPVLHMFDRPEVEPKPSGVKGVPVKGNKGDKKPTKSTENEISVKREHLSSATEIGRFISRDFQNKYNLNVDDGESEKKLFSIIYDLERFLKEKDSLVGETVIMFGKITRTKRAYHLSVYFDGESTYMRAYIDGPVLKEIKKSIEVDRYALIKGKYSENYFEQIIINRADNFYVFDKNIDK